MILKHKTLVMNALEIKQKRKELGLKQEDLAKKLGVSVKTISNYENGEVIPESKKELLHSILSKKEENVLNEPNAIYTSKKEIIKNLESEIKLKDKIIKLLEEKIELTEKQNQIKTDS
jgi:transcriptional regulator with XRE-family HTH domain